MNSSQRTSPAPRELFLSALEKSPGQRAAFLDSACRADQALRQQVEELLRTQEEIGSFLEMPAMVDARGAAPASDLFFSAASFLAEVTEKPGDRIGRYKLLQVIGEGGCGVVYMAEQEEPVRRRVALKVIKLGMDTKGVIARFEAERQALAMMDHPNIARVLDAGATETGRPYFVMELVRGVRITDYCDQAQLPTRERLRLFVQVCQALQHAHQKGVIHRDIKPSNILVTLHDGVAVPKVIDFGIAKATDQRLTDKTLFTEFTAFIGTPAYMSPEQAEMSGLDIDTRSDIYSLGVLFYEVLTGRTPFDAETLLRAGLDECRRTIREKEPAKPSTRLASLGQGDLATTAEHRRTEAIKLIHSLRGDLDCVAMKCLEKDRTRRYPTANDLALDIQRYLENEPILARPPSNLYRLRKLVRRHRAAFAAAAGIAIALLAGAGISTWQAVRAIRAEHRARSAQHKESDLRQQAEQERERAEREKTSSRLNEYVADINLTHQSLAAGNLGRALQLLEKHRPQPGEPDLRGFEWRYLWQLCQGDEHRTLPEQRTPVLSLVCSPDARWIAIGMRDKIRIYDARSYSLVTTIAKGGVGLVFLPDSKTLISASPSTARAWRTTDWTEIKALPENFGPITLAADGSRLATSSRDGVRVWNTTSWNELRLLPGASGPIAFSPDGKRVVADAGGTLKVWTLEQPDPPLMLRDSTNLFTRGGFWSRVGGLTFSPDGNSIVATRNSLSERGVFVLSVWDARTGEETDVIPDTPDHVEHTGAISALAFSPDGRTLASASFDYSIRIWDLTTRQRLRTLQGHASEVWALTFAPDGETLISAAKDGGVKLWPTHTHPKEDVIPGAWQPLGFSKDGRTLAALGRGAAVAFLNVATREAEQQFQPETQSERGRFRFGPMPFALSADLRTLAYAPEDGFVQLWHTDTREVERIKAPLDRVDLLALSPDGRCLISGARGRSLHCTDLRNSTHVRLNTEAHRVLFSPDGATLAVFPWGHTVQLWDLATHSRRTNLVVEPAPDLGLPFTSPSGVAFSPDGRLLAIVCQDDDIRLWDTTTAKLVGTCTGHKQRVFATVFAPDGKTLATTSEDSTLKLWNVATQQELLTIRRLGGAMREVLFSPDGRFLVGARGLVSRNGGLRFYPAPLLRETAAPTEPLDSDAPQPR